jgi:hypothetical protein
MALPGEDDLDVEVIDGDDLPDVDDDISDDELEGDEDDLDIEIVDATPEADRGKPTRAEAGEPDIPTDDEVKKYGQRAQDRIKQLKYEYHTERRTREEAARRENEAINFAKAALVENQKLKAALQQGEVQLVTQSKAGAEAALREAEIAYTQAHEAGDTEKMLDAQKKIAQATVSLNAVATYRPQYQQPAQPTTQQQVQPQPPAQRQPAAPAQPQTSNKTADWLSRNRWYSKDPEMTRFAQGVDERLRFQDGVDPKVDEDRYWSEVDKAMRSKFPERFEGTGEKPPARRTKVAGGTRTPKGKTTKVTLTQDEAAVAKRMGVSLKEYARQKQLLEG